MVRSSVSASTAVTTTATKLTVSSVHSSAKFLTLVIRGAVTSGSPTSATVRITRDTNGDVALSRESTLTLLSGLGTSSNISAVESLDGLSFDNKSSASASNSAYTTVYVWIDLDAGAANLVAELHYESGRD